MRIDVQLPEAELERELAALYQRLRQVLDQSPVVHGLGWPGLQVRQRMADGEHFFYVIDTARDRLVAYVCFNRLVEIERRADRHLRAPHSKVSAAYRRRGIVLALYRRWLAQGRSMISGARQSPAAYALWRRLALEHPLLHVRIEARRLQPLAPPLPPDLLEGLDTRLVLLGRGAAPEVFLGPPAARCRRTLAVPHTAATGTFP